MRRHRHDFKRGLGAFRTQASTGAYIADVQAYQITTTSAVISWTVGPEDMTGYVEYGTTTAYGSTTTPAVNPWPQHVQTITGLSPGTEYHYRCVSATVGGEVVVSADYTFTTLGAPASTGLTYGPALHMDTKDNFRLNGTAEGASSGAGKLFGIRWKATTSSTLTSISLPFRWDSVGTGYSGAYPDGWGQVRVRIMDDDGGNPDFGSVLSTTVFTPATDLDLSGKSTSSGELWHPITITTPPSLTSGSTYHAIFDNPDYLNGSISFNSCLIWGEQYHNASATVRPFTRAQPKWDPADLTWEHPDGVFTTGALVSDFHSPFVDLAYADGTVDGWGAPHNLSWPFWRAVGGNAKVRERFTATEAVEIDRLWVRAGLYSGSGDLSIRLEESDGTLVGEGTATGSGSTTTYWDRESIVRVTVPNGSWNVVTITPATLTIGQEYHLIASAPAGTEYTMAPVLRTSSAMTSWQPQSEQFEEGIGEYTTDGSSWTAMYGSWYPNHAQVFMELT